MTRKMKMLTLLAGATVLGLSAPANAVSPSEVTGAASLATSKHMQLAQRPYDPSAGSVGYKRSNTFQTYERPYDPSAGSVGFKKSKKKKKKR